MMSQMILHECLDEIIGMIISLVPAQGQLLTSAFAGCFQKMRVQLALQKLVRKPLINQNMRI